MKEIKVSVIVPVYNTEKYLKKCLESIKKQTLKEIEVIVVDDGSTDSSPAICDHYKNVDSFRVFHIKNGGVSAARNFGIAQASGQYCMFVDSDDWLERTACEQLYLFAKKCNADLVIGGHVNESTVESKERFIFSDTWVFTDEQYKKEILIHTLGLVEDNLKNPAKLDKLTPVWARLYRLSIIKQNNIKFIDLNKLPSECLQFNFEFSMHAEIAAFLNSITYHYRRNTSISVTKPYRDDLWSKWKWWINYEKNYMTQNKTDKDLWKAYYSRICCSIIPLGGNAVKLRSYIDKRNECKSFLHQKEIKKAFSKTDFSCCPVYWRVFFACARFEYVDFFLFLTIIMRLMLKKRKA